MALDMFMKIDDVKGEARDAAYEGQIDVLNWNWGLSMATTTHAGGGGGSGKVNVQNLSFTKWIDKSTTNLVTATCSGKHFKEALLTVRKSAGDKPVDYLKVTMKEVMVASVTTGATGSEDRLTETVTLNFGEFKIEYTPQETTGGAGGAVESTWNIAKNAPQ